MPNQPHLPEGEFKRALEFLEDLEAEGDLTAVGEAELHVYRHVLSDLPAIEAAAVERFEERLELDDCVHSLQVILRRVHGNVRGYPDGPELEGALAIVKELKKSLAALDSVMKGEGDG